jgi:hypothetical protein
MPASPLLAGAEQRPVGGSAAQRAEARPAARVLAVVHRGAAAVRTAVTRRLPDLLGHLDQVTGYLAQSFGLTTTTV